MWKRVGQILTPPVFEDKDKTRIASLLNIILLSIFLVTLILTLLAGLIGTTATQNLVNGAVLAMLALAMWFIMRRGHVEWVSALLALTLWASSTIAIYYTGTIRAPIATVYVLGIVVAGLLLGNRAAFVATVFSLLALLALLWAENAGLLPPVQTSTAGITQWITYAAALGITAVLLGLATRSINDALERARRSARALTKANKRLQREITERKLSEGALRESELKYRTLFEASTDAIFLETLEGQVLDCNAAACEMFGYTKEELIELTVVDLVPEKVAAMLPDVITKELTSGGIFMEAANKRKDGQVFPVKVSTQLITIENEQRVIAYIRDITERKRTEEALRESEARYRAVVEDQTEMICRFLPDGTLTFVNKAFCRSAGMERDTLLGKSLFSFMPVEAQELVKERLATLSYDHPVTTYEFQIVKPSGQIRWEQWTDRVLFDDRRRLVEYQSVGRDVTERKRTEQALRREHDLAQALEKATASLTATLDPDQVLDRILEQVGRVVPNDATNIMLVEETRRARIVRWRGYEHFGVESFISTAVFDLDQVRNLRQMAETGEPVVIPETASYPGWVSTPEQAWLRSYAGAPIQVRGEVVGFLNVDSAVPGFFTQAHTQALRAFASHAAAALENARLYEAERERRHVAETLRQASTVLSSTLELGKVLELILAQLRQVIPYDSASVQRLTGKKERLEIVACQGFEKPDKVMGLIFPLDPKFPNHRVITTRTSLAIEDIVQDYPHFQEEADTFQSGLIRSWLGVPLIVKDSVIGMIALDRVDVRPYTVEESQLAMAFANQAAIAIENARLYEAEQRRSRELAAALERQKELDRLQNEFIQNVSHELRTPLALIRGYAEMLDNGELGELARDQREPVSTIARRARLLGDLVEDITSILELEAPKIAPMPVELGEVVRQVLADFQSWADRKQITLRGKIADGVPPVMGEATQLRKVVDNLISNALKFTPEKGDVTVNLEHDARGLTVRVTDTGIGIPADKLDRVFERFYQVDGSASRRYSGTGLGLALVKEIVELYNGAVSVESQPGQGSVFVVWLPLT